MYPVEAEIGDERIASFHPKLIHSQFVLTLFLLFYSRMNIECNNLYIREDFHSMINYNKLTQDSMRIKAQQRYTFQRKKHFVLFIPFFFSFPFFPFLNKSPFRME